MFPFIIAYWILQNMSMALEQFCNLPAQSAAM